ncbi:MAG: helix-turn-helix transcriptional regulator [Candidatus Micrarchaeaceae archaeon]
MNQNAKYKSLQNFSVFAISVGVLLILAAIISGVSIGIALGRGVLIHTVSDIRDNVVRFIFSFVIPLIGGIVLIYTGLGLLKVDRDMANRSFDFRSRKRVVRQKEHMLDVFLNDDEKRVMEMLKGDPRGSLQSDVVIKTGYSKVKVHRILKMLERKGLIRRGRLGITNKIIVNK